MMYFYMEISNLIYETTGAVFIQLFSLSLGLWDSLRLLFYRRMLIRYVQYKSYHMAH